jgi:hypothetical protein
MNIKDDKAAIPVFPPPPAKTAEELDLPSKKGTRSRPVKKRRYHEITAFKGKVAEVLGTLHEAGHTVEFVVPSPDIRGVEIYSYTEE